MSEGERVSAPIELVECAIKALEDTLWRLDGAELRRAKVAVSRLSKLLVCDEYAKAWGQR